jgi:hypothetical protein
LLEGVQNAAANAGGIREGFKPWRVCRPFLVPEIAVRSAGREHECVISDRLAIYDNAAGGGIYRGDSATQDAQFCVVSKGGADGRRDIGRRKTGGRDLIQQRLEQMVVMEVDQRHLRRLVAQPRRARHAAKPCADDNDMRCILGRRQ